MDRTKVLVERIIGTSLKIKEAVETVHSNNNDCRDIEALVSRIRELMSLLQDSETLKHPAIESAFKDLSDAIDNAYKLVRDSQRRRMMCCFLVPRRNKAKQLRQIKIDISASMMVAIFASNVVVFTGDSFPQDPLFDDRPQRRPIVRLSGFTEFDLLELEAATNNFSDQNIIGRSDFPSVYKGLLRGADVAIKKHVRTIEYSTVRASDGLSLVSKLEHENIVKVLGYAHATNVASSRVGHSQREKTFCFLVVQEYMPNGSLESSRRINWSSRFKIIKEIASGLCYLHKQRVIHSNLKSSNIILDSDMKPKICDFAVGRVLDHDDTLTNQDLSTVGYMAPEYLADGSSVTTKCDVYAFGVIILETISRMCKIEDPGKEPACRQASIEWAWEVQRQKNFLVKKPGMKELLDPSMCQESQLKEVERCMVIGLLCTQYKPEDRPTMADVHMMLNNFDKKLPTPKQPSYTKGREMMCLCP